MKNLLFLRLSLKYFMAKNLYLVYDDVRANKNQGRTGEPEISHGGTRDIQKGEKV